MKRSVRLRAVAILAAACATALTPHEGGAISGAAPGAEVGSNSGALRCDPERAASVGGAGGSPMGAISGNAGLHRKVTDPSRTPVPTTPAQVVTPPPGVENPTGH